MQNSNKMKLKLLHVVCIIAELRRTQQHLFALKNKIKHVQLLFFHIVPHSLFSIEAVIVTKVDQSLVVECKAAETIFHCKALKTKIKSKINVGSYAACFTANTFSD